MNNIGATG